jgi:uncharacterized repeat protein (TIGR01451 family)
VVNPAVDVDIDDSAANNNGAIDPGEPILLTINLTNPWRAAGKAVTSATAVLSTGTSGITIWDNTAAFGAIAPQGSAAAGDDFLITVAPSVLCESSINFTLTVTSNLGTTATTFSLRVGLVSGTDAPVTYTFDPNPDLVIPDNGRRAVFTTGTIPDDYEIADLNLRADSVTHTFVGDLTFMLRSPEGIGEDSISLIGGLTDGGSGDNLTNMVIDDDLPSAATEDMVQQTNAANPFTGDWLPVFNAPWPTLAGFPPEDPVGTFERYTGKSSQGVWSMAASDQFAVDSGTLNSWSIIVTPVNRVCAAFGGAAVVTATKTVAGTFTVGGTVTYTVTLTNTGTAGQGDNPGNEFIDVLPASLTLVSAIASSGAATANVNPNEVTWNGTLAPLGGSVTITITATVNVGAAGSVCNQGTASYDSDNNGTNNATVLTDDPSVGGAADPTCFTVGTVSLSATKSVSGTFSEGGAITYTIVITNSGTVASPDNAGNEFTDTLPASLTVGTPTASSGTVSGPGINPVTWSGSVPASGSVTITIPATINAGTAGQTVSNQGTVSYDADFNGSNETTVQTDDPGTPGPGQPTVFVVGINGFNPEIPTLSQLGALMLALGLAGLGLLALRRRS